MIYRLSYEGHEQLIELMESHRHIIDGPKFKIREAAQRFTCKFPAPYGVIKYAQIKVEKQTVKDGKLLWVYYTSEQICLPQTQPASRDEYEPILKDIVCQLPPALQDFVGSEAYERGHSSGYGECLAIAKDVTANLLRILPQLKKELK